MFDALQAYHQQLALGRPAGWPQQSLQNPHGLMPPDGFQFGGGLPLGSMYNRPRRPFIANNPYGTRQQLQPWLTRQNPYLERRRQQRQASWYPKNEPPHPTW